MKKYFLSLLVLLSISPVFSYGQPATVASEPVKLDYSGLVKCDGVVAKEGEPDRQNKCDFAALLATVKSTINWLFVITIPIATVLLAYGGLLYISGSQGNIGKAKKIFSSIAKGFIIMLVAWFSVITVVNWFISDNNKPVINTFVNTAK